MGVTMYDTCPDCYVTIHYFRDGKTTTYDHDYNCKVKKQERIIQCRMEQMFGK